MIKKLLIVLAAFIVLPGVLGGLEVVRPYFEWGDTSSPHAREYRAENDNIVLNDTNAMIRSRFRNGVLLGNCAAVLVAIFVFLSSFTDSAVKKRKQRERG